jgi:hypothetical protein
MLSCNEKSRKEDKSVSSFVQKFSARCHKYLKNICKQERVLMDCRTVCACMMR